ncbi:MAG: cyclase [Pseudomonadota bacterium]|jgi:cyclase|nr:cyclase [Pseudomonadota bacterium]
MSSRMLLLWSCAVLLLASAPAWPSDAPPAEPQIVAQPLRGGLHVISGAGSNVAVWHGTDGTVLVDDGVGTLAPELLAAVEKIAPGPVRVVISTHWHPDHTGGNEHFAGSGSVLMAHDNVRARLSEPQTVAAYDLEVPAAPAGALPIVTFDDALSLHLNGDRLAALHVEAAHTDGDLVLWWEDANVVHVGDVYYSGMYPFIDLGSGGSLAGVVAALETVLSRADSRTIIIPGHGPVSNRAELAAYRDMLVATGRRVRELIGEGRNLDEVLAARPTAAYDAVYGQGSMTVERFVGILFEDLAGRR